jgi:hypothetical protein
MNAEGWHKVSEYLPHLQAIRLAEKRMSAVEIVAPPEMLEKSVDATVLSIDTGVQVQVETTECSVQFSPILVHQGMSAVPGLNDVSVDARPTFQEAGVLVIPAPLENSIGSSVVGRAVGSSTNAASKSLEAIIKTVAPKETPENQTEPALETSLLMRVATHPHPPPTFSPPVLLPTLPTMLPLMMGLPDLTSCRQHHQVPTASNRSP